LDTSDCTSNRMKMSETLRVSIVIPVHNEEENIIDTLQTVESNFNNCDCEIVVANDYSTDNTCGIVDSFRKQHSNVKLVNNDSDKGFAYALRTGFRYVSYEVVVPVMADLCDDVATINKMLEKIKEGFDVVCASRYIKGGSRYGGSKIKGVLSRWAGISIHFLLGIPTHDIANAFKMYRREVLENIVINSSSFEISMELPLKAYFKGFKITEVPTVWRERTKGKSSFRILRLIPNYLKLYSWGIFMGFKKRMRMR